MSPASGKRRGALDLLHLAALITTVAHRGGRRDEIEVVLALEALLDDLAVQEAQEAAAEAEAQGRAGLRLVAEGGVVQAQLLERLLQGS